MFHISVKLYSDFRLKVVLCVKYGYINELESDSQVKRQIRMFNGKFLLADSTYVNLIE